MPASTRHLFVLAAIVLVNAPATGSAAPAGADLLRGAIDFHCHSAPDTMARSVDDIQLAQLARAAGMRGIVLKNHYTMTADRAQVAATVTGAGIEIFGGIVLNRSVGGINAEAVRRMAEMTGRRGKVVWLPTHDAANAMHAAGETRASVPVVVDGRPVPALAEVFEVVAQHGLVLATSHASAVESLILIAAARAAGVRHVVVTHALFPMLGATTEQLVAMARLGATLEFAWLMHHAPAPAPGLPAVLRRPMVPLARCVDAIRTIGSQHVVISSDFGQAANPPPPEGLRTFVTALLDAGIAAEDIDLMVRRNPARLLGLDP